MDIASLADISEAIRSGFTTWDTLGDVKAVYKDGLLLLSYTQMAQINNRWNFLERVSRGLIFDAANGELVARPFSKFFNMGERVPNEGTHIVEATEKMDGSLGIVYHHNGAWHVATRGAFDSEQAQTAEALLTEYNITELDPAYTFLCEIIAPQHRIVVNYGSRRELVLIGCIDKDSGRDLLWTELNVIAGYVGFSLPQRYTFATASAYLSLADTLSANEEGWVLRYSDGTRFKIKGEAYKRIHKVATGVATPKRVAEIMQFGQLDSYLDGIPDEFLTEIKAIQADVQLYMEETKQLIEQAMAEAPFDAPRKDFALFVMKNYAPVAKYLFLAFDKRTWTDAQIIDGYIKQLKED